MRRGRRRVGRLDGVLTPAGQLPFGMTTPPEPPELPPAPALGSEFQPERKSLRGPVIGGAIGFVAYLAVLGFTGASNSGDRSNWGIGIFIFMILLSIVAGIVAIVLVAVPKTRRIGVGVLIGLAAGFIIDAGTCIALLRTA
jgi:hypothetical protein